MQTTATEHTGWVRGLSMWPNLIPGDILRASECHASDLRPGMIAVFPGDEVSRFIVHRVARVWNYSGTVVVVSAGDRSGLDDERRLLNPCDTVKIVKGVLRKGRYRCVTSIRVSPELFTMPFAKIYCGIVRRFFW